MKTLSQSAEEISLKLFGQDLDGKQIDLRVMGYFLKSGARPTADMVMQLSDAVRARLEQMAAQGQA
jgi:hypothetical protein